MSSEPLIVTPFDKLRFLVIDDDRAILELLEAILRLAGVGSVIKATSALTALNILADEGKKFDCVICDCSMPNMTGLELLRQIRSAQYAHIPRDMRFIMVTMSGQEAVVKAALQLDVSGYIVKPVSKDALIKSVHRAFNRTPPMKAPGDYSSVPLPSETDKGP